jgi:hypothetical protein
MARETSIQLTQPSEVNIPQKSGEKRKKKSMYPVRPADILSLLQTSFVLPGVNHPP